MNIERRKFMKYNFKLLTVLLYCCNVISTDVQAQYFYKDILTNKEIRKEFEKLKSANIHDIKIKSFEPGGEPTEDFLCEKKISKDYLTIQLTTKSSESGESIMTSHCDKTGKLLKTYDSSDIVVTENKLIYDSMERLTQIVSQSRSNDDDFKNEITEEHLYSYGANANPIGLTIIKNYKDTNIILFYLDDQNRISIEKDTKTAFKYYYYYDIAGRLTDIVHSNAYTQQPVADYIFEYNTEGELSGMTNSVGNANNTLIWKYDYENGLRIKERAFNADKKFLGKVEYEYVK
jgi:hypothetical protein